jgi:hypothetical protein
MLSVTPDASAVAGANADIAVNTSANAIKPAKNFFIDFLLL